MKKENQMYLVDEEIILAIQAQALKKGSSDMLEFIERNYSIVSDPLDPLYDFVDFLAEQGIDVEDELEEFLDNEDGY